MSMRDWVTAVQTELGIKLDLDTDLVLEVARDAAHLVERPAAPVTTFLIGYAAALRGGGSDHVDEVAAQVSRLTETWLAERG
ncbi:MAG: DUF6457 domain-containing protein [Nocardioidaceae bacterium]